MDPSPPAPTTVGRLAPSPTGGLHLGHARTFLAAWLAARQAAGRVVSSDRRPRRLPRPPRGVARGDRRPALAGPRLGRRALRPVRAYGQRTSESLERLKARELRLPLHLYAGRHRPSRLRPARRGRRARLSGHLREPERRRTPRRSATAPSPGGFASDPARSRGTTCSSGRPRVDPESTAATSSSDARTLAPPTSWRSSRTTRPWASRR